MLSSPCCVSFFSIQISSGKLDWSPVHRSERFWQENAAKLNDKNHELLKRLVIYLKKADDITVSFSLGASNFNKRPSITKCTRSNQYHAHMAMANIYSGYACHEISFSLFRAFSPGHPTTYFICVVLGYRY